MRQRWTCLAHKHLQCGAVERGRHPPNTRGRARWGASRLQRRVIAHIARETRITAESEYSEKRGKDARHNDSGLLSTMDSRLDSPYLRLRSVLDDRQVVEDGPAAQGRHVLVGDGGVLTAWSLAPSQVSQQFQILRFTTHVPLVNLCTS